MTQPIYAAADSSGFSPNNSTQDTNLETESFIDEDTFPEDDDLWDESKPKEPFFSFLDEPQDFISSGVESVVKSIDEFFSDDKIFYEASGTYLRLRADTIFNEAGDVGYAGNIRLKLRLPNTKRKLKFTFESDANERPDDESTAQAENTPIEAVEENDYFAGLQATLGRKDGWQFKPSIGLRLSSGVEPYVKFRFKRKYEFTKWSINLHETPYWFDSFGWGFDSYFELNRKISEDDLFRASTFARWTNESDKFELSQVFSMYHVLSKKRAVSYFAGVYGESEPTVYATHYLIGLTYRQNIHKDYLFVELIPQIKYDKINDFQAEHSIILRFEMVFKK
jgi:hypothetical protein